MLFVNDKSAVFNKKMNMNKFLTRRKMLKASGETGNLNLLSRQPYSLYGFAALKTSIFRDFVLLRQLQVPNVQHSSVIPFEFTESEMMNSFLSLFSDLESCHPDFSSSLGISGNRTSLQSPRSS